MRVPLASKDGNSYRITWDDETQNRRPPYVWRTPVIDALVHVVNHHDRVTAIICLDAALNNRRQKDGEDKPGIVETDLDEIFARAPVRARPWRREVDGRAGSGGETEFRLKTLAAGIPFVPQPHIDGVGYLDGQIGPTTFVEVDGAEWHDNEVAFEVDRNRDVTVASKNGRVLRFSYRLFRTKWHVCEKAMRTALADDYTLNKTTDFPAFPLRMAPAKDSRARTRRIDADPEPFDADGHRRGRKVG
jgi:hypothetical protein